MEIQQLCPAVQSWLHYLFIEQPAIPVLVGAILLFLHWPHLKILYMERQNRIKMQKPIKLNLGRHWNEYD
jgi:hypothetical protein